MEALKAAVAEAKAGNDVQRLEAAAAVNIGEAKSFTESGSPFRNLGQMSAKRVDIAPDVPTFREQGFEIEMASLTRLGLSGKKNRTRQSQVDWRRSSKGTKTISSRRVSGFVLHNPIQSLPCI